ncbi:hypothetical protein HY837_04220 [archaeon]|nr:hypothetical protein [archaeon]
MIKNKTSFLWQGKKEDKTNYVASTLVSEENLEDILSDFEERINQMWETPLIQVTECYVNKKFEKYMKN